MKDWIEEFAVIDAAALVCSGLIVRVWTHWGTETALKVIVTAVLSYVVVTAIEGHVRYRQLRSARARVRLLDAYPEIADLEKQRARKEQEPYAERKLQALRRRRGIYWCIGIAVSACLSLVYVWTVGLGHSAHPLGLRLGASALGVSLLWIAISSYRKLRREERYL